MPQASRPLHSAPQVAVALLGSLTRKRSQVQTLSRPPPFSQVKALPAPSLEHPLHTWAALGPRAHPRRQPRWSLRARPLGRQAPRQPRRVVALQPRWQPRGGFGNVALQPAPCLAQSPATGRPLRRSGLPGRSAAASRPSTTRPRSAADAPPLASTRPPQRCPRPGLLGPSTEPLGTGRTTWNSPRSSRDGCPGRTDVSPSPPPADGDEMDAIGRTDGHQTAGRRTGWHQTAGQPDPDEGARQPDTGRAGHRTADTWTPDVSASGRSRRNGRLRRPFLRLMAHTEMSP
jgi:hypothetical protein